MFFLGRRSVSARSFESFDRVRVRVRVGVEWEWEWEWSRSGSRSRSRSRSRSTKKCQPYSARSFVMSRLATASEKVVVQPNYQCFPRLFVLVTRTRTRTRSLTRTRQQSIDRHPRSRELGPRKLKKHTSQLGSGGYVLARPPSGDGGYVATAAKRWIAVEYVT